VNAAFAREAARVLRAGGRLRFATDWASYADQALEVFTHSPAFTWTANRADDWRLAPADHVTTRYEAKRLGDCAPIWLEFVEDAERSLAQGRPSMHDGRGWNRTAQAPARPQ
jgi:tRNA (guanine-N7-)-methyltransferase